MRNMTRHLLNALFATMAFAAAMWPARAFPAETAPADKAPSVRFIYQDVRLYCTELGDAEEMAQAMVDGGEGSHTIPRPKTCYLNRITYEVVGIVALHEKNNINVKVVEVKDAAVPAKKYYLIVPTQFIPPNFHRS
jgi:hypothetical protein